MPDIDLLMRTNFLQKRGGDTLQVGKYIEHLAARGFNFRTLPSTRDTELRPGAAAHIVNVDRPYEFLAASEAARKAGATVFLSPIHHQQERISAMDRSRPGLLGHAGRLISDSAGREWAKHLLRSRSRDLRWIWNQPREESELNAKLRSAIEGVDCLLLLAKGEELALRNDFGIDYHRKAAVIPNGVDVDQSVAIDKERDIDVLLVGRVEERKNQVAVLETLVGLGSLNILIIGELTGRSRKFRSCFQKIVDSSPNVRWNGLLPPAELPKYYARAKLVVNASYVEVLSLVEMEALAYGCNLIGSIDGNTKEYFGQFATFVSAEAVSTDLPALVNAALSAPPNLQAASLIRRDFTWSSVADCLAEQYLHGVA